MSLTDVLLVLAGLVVLITGGESLVRGASTLASKLGISNLVIGLVVVSAATSAPELAVTLGAVLGGEPGLAVGNVVGSNIVNILFILGLSAIFLPLLIQRQVVRFDMPVMLSMALALLFFSFDGEISQIEGVLLFAGLLFHTIASIRIGRKEVVTENITPAQPALNAKPVKLWLALILLVVGIGALALGAQLLVTGAVNIATSLGISGLVIGLTVVAIGTSLPELATSIIAIRRGERDMAVGNIVGSNIFNIGMVLGLPAILFAEGIPIPPAAIAVDLPLMVAASLALVPIAFTGFSIARWEGGLFVGLYAAYITFVILDSTGHDAATGFTAVMLWFVMPLIAATIVALTIFEIRLIRNRKKSNPD
ncbi:MAG: calcium/sodium antiporter [Aquiluna sp.]